MVNLGDRLKSLRDATNLKQSVVAQRIGVTDGMISAYEHGSRSPSFETLVKLAALYGVSTDYLLGREKARALNVEGLTDKEISVIAAMVDLLRSR